MYKLAKEIMTLVSQIIAKFSDSDANMIVIIGTLQSQAVGNDSIIIYLETIKHLYCNLNKIKKEGNLA